MASSISTMPSVTTPSPTHGKMDSARSIAAFKIHSFGNIASCRKNCHHIGGRQLCDRQQCRRPREQGSGAIFTDEAVLGPHVPYRRFPILSILIKRRNYHLRRRG